MCVKRKGLNGGKIGSGHVHSRSTTKGGTIPVDHCRGQYPFRESDTGRKGGEETRGNNLPQSERNETHENHRRERTSLINVDRLEKKTKKEKKEVLTVISVLLSFFSNQPLQSGNANELVAFVTNIDSNDAIPFSASRRILQIVCEGAFSSPPSSPHPFLHVILHLALRNDLHK